MCCIPSSASGVTSTSIPNFSASSAETQLPALPDSLACFHRLPGLTGFSGARRNAATLHYFTGTRARHLAPSAPQSAPRPPTTPQPKALLESRTFTGNHIKPSRASWLSLILNLSLARRHPIIFTSRPGILSSLLRTVSFNSPSRHRPAWSRRHGSQPATAVVDGSRRSRQGEDGAGKKPTLQLWHTCLLVSSS